MIIRAKIGRNLKLLRGLTNPQLHGGFSPHCGEKVRPLFEEAARAQYGDDPGLAGGSLAVAQLALCHCLNSNLTDLEILENAEGEIERWFSFFGFWWSARLLEKGEIKKATVILEDLEESFGPHAEHLGILQDYGREETERVHTLIMQALDSMKRGDYLTATKLADTTANIQYNLTIERAGIPAPRPETWKQTPPLAPEALMDYLVEARLRLDIDKARRDYEEYGEWNKNVFEPMVPISQIDLPAPWNKLRYIDNKEKISETGKMPPAFLNFDEDTQMYGVTDGVHRINVSKDLGYLYVPAVVSYRRTTPP